MGDHGEIESPPLLPNSLGLINYRREQDPLKEELLIAITKLLRFLPTKD
jgi:hypothetical protein